MNLEIFMLSEVNQTQKAYIVWFHFYIISRLEAESRLEFIWGLIEWRHGQLFLFFVIYFLSDTVLMAVQHCKSNECIKMIAFVVYVFYYINCF